jgi:DNA-binding response OmpR family regulator
MPAILIVEDEVPLRRAVRRWLQRGRLTVHTAGSVAAAKRCFARHAIDAAVIDVWLRDGTGVALYEWIRAQRPAVAARVAFVTGDIRDSPIADVRLESLGRPVLVKPFELAQLDALVARWFGAGGVEKSADLHAPPAGGG